MQHNVWNQMVTLFLHINNDEKASENSVDSRECDRKKCQGSRGICEGPLLHSTLAGKPRLFRCLVPPDAAATLDGHCLAPLSRSKRDYRAVVVDRQEQWEAVHTQLCVGVFHNALASGLSLAVAPALNHLSLPLVSQFRELSDYRQQELRNFWNGMKAFKETRFPPEGLWERLLRQTAYHLKVLSFTVAAVVWDLCSFVNISFCMRLIQNINSWRKR